MLYYSPAELQDTFTFIHIAMSSKLHKISTTPPKHLDKKKIKKENEKMIAKLKEYQYKMYAE